MKQKNNFIYDMLDLDEFPDSEIWIAERVAALEELGDGSLGAEVMFVKLNWENGIKVDDSAEPESEQLIISSYSPGFIRVTNTPKSLSTSPMIDLDASVQKETLRVREDNGLLCIETDTGESRGSFNLPQPGIKFWSDQIEAPFSRFSGCLTPDKKSELIFSTWDQFVPTQMESIPLGYVKRRHGVGSDGKTGGINGKEWIFSFHVGYDEHFFGTGERFHSFDLRGQTITLENTDALGVNNRRSYKNIPFYLSSAGYGLFIHSSAHIRLSLADISTRSAQGLIEDDVLDLCIIGGGFPERVLHTYRLITGFPGTLPAWSYGTWMSRMTYFSDEEITEIFTRMRNEEYPCDVIHIDTGWFAKDWVCEWTFSDERFPDPKDFMDRMRAMGYRISLWQTPNIGEGNRLLDIAKEKRYLAPMKSTASSASDFSGQGIGGQIDFTNPEAVDWYKGMLKKLFDYGASVIKTDFGENISLNADYQGMPARLLHNLYALLYQKAAYEATEEYQGEGIIWARSSWAGSQRYPLHWGGDAAATWDGMAGSLVGGLQLGLSGFAYWSHDVPGFHGLPDFMNSYPSEELYLRWTQFGVLSSHLRYHGTCAREPWEYPGVADAVRQWLRLRYALIPYLLRESERGVDSGLPMLRALFLHYPQDPVCWTISDQYLLGRDILAAPVMNDASSRSVYLPGGEWIDFWSGEKLQGEQWIKDKRWPLSRMPLYVRSGAVIPFYPEAVSCTDDMTRDARHITFDQGYRGFKESFLGTYIDL